MNNQDNFRKFMQEKTEKIISKFSDINSQQRSKGLLEYGKFLEECHLTDYDWNLEALRECIDANAYLCMENARLRELLKGKYKNNEY